MPSTWQNIRSSRWKNDFCKREEGIHRGIHAVMHLIEDHAQAAQIPVCFAASKVLEGDEKILEQLKLTDHERTVLEEISRQTEEETGMTGRLQWRRCVLTT